MTTMVTGGDFDTLQRNDNVTTFVKRGAREAKINIELYNEEGDNWVVGSVISDKGKFSWTINGEKAVKSQVNIYPNGCCYFHLHIRAPG